VTIGATGEAREKGLYDTARDYAFADLKGDLDSIGALAGGLRWADSSARAENGKGSEAWLHVARRGQLFLGKEKIGVAGQLARRVAEKLKLRQDVFLAELRLDPLYAAVRAARDSRRYDPVPRFPAVERDFSLLLTDGTRFSEVGEAIRVLKIPEIASIEAIDFFRGKNVPAGKYSLLVRITFQSRETTLTDEQINDFCARIIAALENNLGAQLRAS
jgi:phenylalanyl-tRNA synthetase beta chain